MAFRGDLDEYIKLHHGAMSQAEMARATGASTSSVSRHVIALRAAGQLDPPSGGSGPDHARRERLEALEELVCLLHSELSAAGGQTIASVSTEYRKALEELDAIRAEAGDHGGGRYHVTLADRMQMQARYAEAMRNASHCDAQNGAEPFDVAFSAIIAHLRDRGAIAVG